MFAKILLGTSLNKNIMKTYTLAPVLLLDEVTVAVQSHGT